MADRFRMTPTFLQLMLSFSAEPRHGYAVMKEIESRTGGQVRLGPSSLYYAIGRLEKEGLVEEVDVEAEGAGEQSSDERRRTYRLTEAGRVLLREEIRKLDAIVSYAQSHGVLR